MQGFDTKALILFPKEDNWTYQDYAYKYQFKKAVDNICRYLVSRGIEPHAFYTDDVARDISNPAIKWVSPLSKADLFFASKYCGLTDALTTPMITMDDIYNAITLKDPGEPDMSVEKRFDMVIRHESAAFKKIIPQYKIVVHFVVKSNAKYSVTSKQNDGKIRIVVAASNFKPTIYMSGNEEDPCDILGVPYANRCLDLWDVNSEVQ